MTEREKVRDLATMDSLNSDEVIEGYFDGRQNFPCGDNRSRSYWHGWRNGRVDGKHAESDAAQAELARLFLAREREKVSA